MDDWPFWIIIFSLPLYITATSGLTGRARFRAFWAYSWLLAGLAVATLWHMTNICQPLLNQAGYSTPPGVEAQYRATLWEGALFVAFLMVLPVVLYRRAGRKASGASPGASAA
jgi:hypothetical protein